MSMKICKICKIKKSLTEFHKLRKWNASYCKLCQSDWIRQWRLNNLEKLREQGRNRSKLVSPKTRRKYKYMTRYGITFNDYEEMFKKQGGLCAICFMPETGQKRSLSVDHCHKTGKVRGLLCDKCNNMLGRAGDNCMVLMSGAYYLEENK